MHVLLSLIVILKSLETLTYLQACGLSGPLQGRLGILTATLSHVHVV